MLLLPFAGCGEEPPDKGFRTCLDLEVSAESLPDIPLTYQTEHLDIHVDEREFVCAGSALEYDRFVTYVAAELDMEIQRRIPVYAMHSTAEYCRAGRGGCVKRNGVVYSYPDNRYHELTHGVACEIAIDAAPMLAEGLAVSFEPDPYPAKRNPAEFADLPRAEYYAAGHLVRWLLETRDLETFLDLYRYTNYRDSAWNAIVAAYGATVADDYAATAPEAWVPHRQCADIPLIEPDPEGWRFGTVLDCGSTTTFGPYERADGTEVNTWGQHWMYQSFLIEVETPGTYRVQRTGGAELNYERCLEHHPATEEKAHAERMESSVWWDSNGTGTIDLELPGLWRFDVIREHGPPATVSITITPDSG